MVQPHDLAKQATHASSARLEESDAGADLRLAEDCRSGDLAAYERLYNLHGPRLKSVAANLLGNVSDAEDVVQEVFLRVYRSIGGFKGQSSFSTWVYRILLNCCHDLQRRGFRRHETSEEDLAHETREASVKGADIPLRMTLELHLAGLPHRQREVFILYEVEGFKHSEIAAMLNISEASSKNILFEGKQRLRRLLLKEGRPS